MKITFNKRLMANETTFDMASGSLTLDGTEGTCQSHSITQGGTGTHLIITDSGTTDKLTTSAVNVVAAKSDGTTLTVKGGSFTSLQMAGMGASTIILLVCWTP